MLSAQIDELRTMAAMLVIKDMPEVASVVREAADTIWQLGEDLRWTSKRLQETEHEESLAWDRVHKAESQVAGLRELAADMLHDAMENVCSRAYWCDEKNWQTCNDKSCGNHLYVDMARELGIEVSE